eukprot:722123-Amorphochlora_amoeboformis.AAC.1
MAAEIAIPGDRMGELKDYEAGPGTYTLNGIIFASVVGVKKMTKAKNENNKKSKQRVEVNIGLARPETPGSRMGENQHLQVIFPSTLDLSKTICIRAPRTWGYHNCEGGKGWSGRK